MSKWNNKYKEDFVFVVINRLKASPHTTFVHQFIQQGYQKNWEIPLSGVGGNILMKIDIFN